MTIRDASSFSIPLVANSSFDAIRMITNCSKSDAVDVSGTRTATAMIPLGKFGVVKPTEVSPN